MTITEDNVFSSNIKGYLDDKQESLGHFLIERLDRNPKKIVYIDFASGREWTAAKLKDTILNIGTCLIKEYGLKQGGTVCCHYPKDPYDELLNLAKKVEFKLLFCQKSNAHWIPKLQNDMKYSVTGVEMDGNSALKGSLNHLLNFQRNGECLVPVACKDLKKDIAIIMMSSGTTGRPKAIPHTHYNSLADFTLGADEEQNAVTAWFSPIDYVSGRLMSLNCIINGGISGIIINGYDIELFLKAIERYRIQCLLMGVGSFYNLISHQKIDQYNISSLAMVCATGVKLSDKVGLKKFIDKHPHVLFWAQIYGTSETSSLSVKLLTSQQILVDSNNCGRLKSGVKIRIVDRETGENLGFNQSGSVRVYTESVFPGYIDKEYMKLSNNEDPFIRDATMFDELGYYITGDIGYFSEDEELFIEGREKELMICRGPKKVLPQEIEDVLLTHPSVLAACVFGVKEKDNPTTDFPRAFVKLKPEYYDLDSTSQKLAHSNGEIKGKQRLEYRGCSKLCTLPEEVRHQISEDIMAFMEEKVGWKKQLVGGLVIIDEIKILLSSGKVDKMYLKSLSLDEVEIYGDQTNQF